MKNTQICVRRTLRASLPALVLGLAFTLTAAPALAEEESEGNRSIFDILIDWIDEFFDPVDPVETLPSEGDGW